MVARFGIKMQKGVRVRVRGTGSKQGITLDLTLTLKTTESQEEITFPDILRRTAPDTH